MKPIYFDLLDECFNCQVHENRCSQQRRMPNTESEVTVVALYTRIRKK